jgi:6-phosphogluconolactonase
MAYPVYVSADPARALAERLADVLNETEQSAIAVSGGSTPRRLFEILASDYREAVPWDRVRVFQVDERSVPPDHDQSNWRMLKETLLDVVPDARGMRMQAERPGGATGYETLIRQALGEKPVFDIVLLGLGADGHTASLFPGTEALHEKERWVVENRVPQLNTTRVTLTYPIINAARHRWFLVSGPGKEEAFRGAQWGENPASGVESPEWFIDPEVAPE